VYCGALGAGVRAVGRPPCSRAPCRIVVALSAPAAAMGTKRRRYAEDVCHLPHTSTSGTRQSGSQHVRARRVWPHMRSARCRHAWCHALLSGVREASMVHYAAPHLQSPRLVVEFDGCTCANHRASDRELQSCCQPVCRHAGRCTRAHAGMSAATKQELGVEPLVGCMQRAFKVLRASWWT